MPLSRRPDSRSVQERLIALAPVQAEPGWTLPPAADEPWGFAPASAVPMAVGPAVVETGAGRVGESSPPRPGGEDLEPGPVDLENLLPPSTSELRSPPWWQRYVPEHLVGSRLDPGRSGLLLLALVALVSTAVSVALVLHGRAAPAGEPLAASSGEVAVQQPEVVVDVAGAVATPGIVRLPAGSRVVDALEQAGGALPGTDISGLNLARPLQDGEQVLVGLVAGDPDGPAADGRLDLNTADAAALEQLPGVGPVLAQRILDWRSDHDRFATVDQLAEVSGLGESKLADIRDRVRV